MVAGDASIRVSAQDESPLATVEITAGGVPLTVSPGSAADTYEASLTTCALTDGVGINIIAVVKDISDQRAMASATVVPANLLAAPVLGGEARGVGHAYLNWTRPCGFDGVESFNLYQSMSSGVSQADPSLNTPEAEYLQTDLVIGATYYFAVAPVAGGMTGSFSNELELALPDYSQPTLLTPGPPETRSRVPDIAVTPDGEVHVAWSDLGTTPNEQLVVHTIGGGTVSLGSTPRTPNIALVGGPDNKIHACWNDDGNIRYATMIAEC